MWAYNVMAVHYYSRIVLAREQARRFNNLERAAAGTQELNPCQVDAS
eukprot:SAG22_NODE_1242_length_5026_cov_2.748731_4_plen_47_part_00